MIRRTYPGERRLSKDSKLTPRETQHEEFGQPPKLTPRETMCDEVAPVQKQHDEVGQTRKLTPRQTQHDEVGQTWKLTPRQSQQEEVGQHRKLTPRNTHNEVVGPPRLTPRQTQHGEVGQHRNLTPRQIQHAEVGQSLKLLPRQPQHEAVVQPGKLTPRQKQHDAVGQPPNLAHVEFEHPYRSTKDNGYETDAQSGVDHPFRDKKENHVEFEHPYRSTKDNGQDTDVQGGVDHPFRGNKENRHEANDQTHVIRPYSANKENQHKANPQTHTVRPVPDNKEGRNQLHRQTKEVRSSEKTSKVHIRTLPAFTANERHQTFSTVSENTAEVEGAHLHELCNLAIGGKAGLSFVKRSRGQRRSSTGTQVYGLERCRTGGQDRTTHESFAMDMTVEASQTLSDISRLMENRLNPSLEPTYEPDSNGRSKASYFSNLGRDARSMANESFPGQPFTNSVILEDTHSSASMSPGETSNTNKSAPNEAWTIQSARKSEDTHSSASLSPAEASNTYKRASAPKETWTMQSARKTANRSIESSTASAATVTETWTVQSARKVANTSIASSADGEVNSVPSRFQEQADPEIESSEPSSSFPDNRTSDDSPEVGHRYVVNRSWSPSPSRFRSSPAKPPRSLSRPVASPLSLDHFPTQRSPTPLSGHSNPSLSPEMQGERAAGLGLRVRPSGGNGGLWVVGAVPDGPAGMAGLVRGDVIMWASLGVTGPKTTGEDVGDLISRQGSNFSVLVGRGRHTGSLASMQLVRLTLHRRDVRYDEDDGEQREEPVGMVVADAKGGNLPFVARVVDGGAADLAGVRVGDQVVGIGVEKVGVHSMSSLLGQQASWILLGVRQKNSDKGELQQTGVDQNGVAWVRVQRELGMPVLLQRKAEINAKDTSLSIASVQPSTTPLPSVSPASLLGTPASLRYGRSPGDSIRILHSDFEPVDLIGSSTTPRRGANGRHIPSPRSSKKASPVPARGSAVKSHSPRVLAHSPCFGRDSAASVGAAADSPRQHQRPASPQAFATQSVSDQAEGAHENSASRTSVSDLTKQEVPRAASPSVNNQDVSARETACKDAVVPAATVQTRPLTLGWGTLHGEMRQTTTPRNKEPRHTTTPRNKERVRRWSSGGGSITRSDLTGTSASTRRQSGSTGQNGSGFPWEKVQWLGLDGRALEEAAWSYVREKKAGGKEGRITPRSDRAGRVTPRQSLSLGRAASSGAAAKALALQQKQEPPEMLDARCVAERTGAPLDVALFMLRRNGMDVVETILSMSVYGQNNGIFA